MKTLILFVTLIVSQSLFAGTGGGGVMMAFANNSTSEIVYHMGEQDGVVRFAHAQFVDNNWQVQKIEAYGEELTASPDFFNALKQSQILKKWTAIKK